MKIPSVRAQILTRSKYNRPLSDGTFETWTQTIDRVISHQKWLWERAAGRELTPGEEAELSELRGLMLSRAVLLAGRTLWLGGTEISRTRESSQFNCSNLSTRNVHDFVDSFWLLLQGCGVGSKPTPGTLNGFHSYIPTIDVIRSTRPTKGGNESNVETVRDGTWTIQVGDSAEAWAKALGKLVAGKYNVQRLVLDFSQIRPAGERLKGYGWMSSGDEQLARVFPQIANVLNNRAGRHLTHLDILDTTNLLGEALATRRAAELAQYEYGKPGWREFALAKKDYFNVAPWRAQSNNSLHFWSKPSRSQMGELFDIILETGGSDPGLLNAEAASRRAPWFSGVNPCFHGDTLIPIIGHGLRRISELADLPYRPAVVDGRGNPSNVVFRKTGEGQTLLTVELSDGSRYKVTPAHNFVQPDGSLLQARHLSEGTKLKAQFIEFPIDGPVNKPREAALAAWQIADGTWWKQDRTDISKVYLYGEKRKYSPLFDGYKSSEDETRTTFYLSDVPSYNKKHIPDFVLQGNSKTQLSFIESYINADGHRDKTDKGIIIQVSSIHRSFLEEFQALLYLLGVKSKISVMSEEGHRDMPGGTYFCQTSYRLTVTNPAKLCVYLWPDMIERGPYEVTPSLSVVSVEDHGEIGDVYCCGEPHTGTFQMPAWTSGNCAEILLPDKGFCNLCEVNVAAFGANFPALLRATYIVARANYRQTLVNLDDGILQRAWHENNQFLRLCGVSLCGVVQRPDLTAYDFRQIRESAKLGANGMANDLGTQVPKNVTTIKPGGTLPKIMDCTEGMSKPLGRYLFNNVVFGNHDELLPHLEKAGYPVRPHPRDPSASLVTFPQEWANVPFTNHNGTLINDESAVSQLERYRMLMDSYCDQNVSCTIYYGPDERSAILDWLDLHWDSYVGVSFLPRHDPTLTAEDLGHPYLPQEVTTKERFHELASKIKSLSLDETLGTSVEDDPCATGACPAN